MVQPQRQRRKSRRKGPAAQALVALVVVGFVGLGTIAAIWFVSRMNPQGGAGGEADSTVDSETERFDPFADWESSDEPVRRTSTPAFRPSSGGDATAGAADVPEELRSDPDWKRALDLIEEAGALSAEAGRAQEAGDMSTMRSKAGDARERYDEALSLTSHWVERLTEQYGASHRGVLAFLRLRQDWRERASILRRMKV